MEITLAQFALATGATEANAGTYYPAAVEAMTRFKIDETADRVAAFLATMAVETIHLTHMEEDLFYKDPLYLAKLFRSRFDTNNDKVIEPSEVEAAKAFCRNPKALSKKLYNGFHGRGGSQLTWEENYRKHGDRLGVDFVNDPEQLVTPYWAMLSAGDYWDLHNCNDVAHDMDEVTLRVNGKARLALAERIAQRNEALKALA